MTGERYQVRLVLVNDRDHFFSARAASAARRARPGTPLGSRRTRAGRGATARVPTAAVTPAPSGAKSKKGGQVATDCGE
jgi:hypothetical protein